MKEADITAATDGGDGNSDDGDQNGQLDAKRNHGRRQPCDLGLLICIKLRYRSADFQHQTDDGIGSGLILV
jgi:hypothetical protein